MSPFWIEAKAGSPNISVSCYEPQEKGEIIQSFNSRGQLPCKFLGTKEVRRFPFTKKNAKILIRGQMARKVLGKVSSDYINKEFNSDRIGLWHQPLRAEYCFSWKDLKFGLKCQILPLYYSTMSFRSHLRILVNVVFEVIVLREHWLRNDVIKLDRDCREQRCFGGLCYPC